MKTLPLLLVSVLVCSNSAVVPAQPSADETGPQEERARLEAERAQNRAQLEAARAELDAVRAELERTAQEVARLSAEQYELMDGRGFRNADFFRFRRPLLGLNISNDEDGVRVVGVSPGGPGEEAGIEIGDLIVAIESVDVDGSADGRPIRRFFEVLNDVEAGGEVELGLLRDGEPMTITVETDESNMPVWFGDIGERVNRAIRDVPRVAGRSIVRVMEQPFFFGAWRDMELVALTPGLGQYFGTDEGLLIVRAPNGDDIDLRDGDVILQIGGRTPQSVGHAMRILRSFEPGETLELSIMREQRQRTLRIDVPESDDDIEVEVD